ncbi:MATE family efflux transporter [Gelidibacter sp.]|uniref:MATE family efflux transporter n=1 Tax=Gelidibacter sp. TaxID=2018083 RepID=UPI003264FDEF
MQKSNYIHIIKLAIPIIIANASVPLLGLVDTASIGQTASAADLGAIALAALIFSFVYWGFGFLRMGTTGFVAQASGAEDNNELHALVFRTIFLGAAIGFILVVLQKLIGEFSVYLLSASDEIKELVKDYFYIRIWGAPATLITFSLLGTLIGMGWTKRLLWVQLFLNGLNIVFNITFVVGFGMGVKGIALGTVLAEWLTLFFAGYVLFHKLGLNRPLARAKELKTQILYPSKLIALFKVNSDIMIRTLALLSGFGWFANQGAKFGDHTLAANHVLLQFVTLSAFFLDGYAHVVEMLAGNAFGAKDKLAFTSQIKQSTVLAGATAVLLALSVFLFSDTVIPLLTKDGQVQTIASNYKNYAVVYILFSFVAFQLDGVFIGVTKSKEMRNATILALIAFIGLSLILVRYYGNAGLWLSFIFYVVVRGVALGAYYPKILKVFDMKKAAI